MVDALAVLDLPELLENILVQLEDWKEPFVLLRVSRRFKATIENSVQLKRKMWLIPKAGDVEFELCAAFEYKDASAPSAQLYNPLIKALDLHMSDFRWPVGNKYSTDVVIGSDLNIEASINGHKCPMDWMGFTKGDSWRRVLCAQKPGLTVDIFYEGVGQPEPPLERERAVYDIGVKLPPHATMGDLVECVQEHLDKVVENLQVEDAETGSSSTTQ
ncbi:hypothetical protein LTR95_000923 [Oleoguttula sp. CCFEE 5521]